MSAQNEHYLQQIATLEKDKTLLQERLDICQRNFNIRNNQYILAATEHYNLCKRLQEMGLYDRVMEGFETVYHPDNTLRKMLLEGVDSRKQENLSQEITCDEGECVDDDLRSLEAHTSRCEMWREWYEGGGDCE